MKGRKLTARERGKVGPVAQADEDSQGLAMWGAWLPPHQGQTLMRLKFNGLVVGNRVSFWG